MSAPFNLTLVFVAMWASEEWALAAARWQFSPESRRMRLSLHARTRAVVVHDRVLNGRLS